MMRDVPTLPPALTSLLLGALLALTLPPLPTGVLSAGVLAALLWHAANARSREGVAGRMFWAGSAMNAVHLWWLTSFLGKLFGTPLMGGLAFVLYALEGLFLAALGYVVARLVRTPLARVWLLAGGWVLLEWLRFLGPLAFPWPTLGYALLPTPMIQVADLGGVLLGSVLVSFTAAALVSFWQGRSTPLWLAVACWLGALSYGITRTPGGGTPQPMRVLRTNFDSFGRATHQLSPAEQYAQTRAASLPRPAGSVVVWSETAVTSWPNPTRIEGFPGPGISGLGILSSATEAKRNAVVAVNDQGQITSMNDKAKLVPFGEFFPFYGSLLHPVYALIERSIGFTLDSIPAPQHLQTLRLNGVLYGAYICYDSVFPWVARSLTAQGAEILVNPSNDGWYSGWGVQQHFMMGRVRAIETRRWLVRSVNEGVAGAVNDLGQPVNTIQTGETLRSLDVTPNRLTGKTWFVRLGNLPALLLALLLCGWGLRQDRQDRR